MIQQYPHIATVIITTDAGTDSEGYPLPPSESNVTLVCRAEPNTSNAVIYTAYGTAYNFQYVVYIKEGQQDIPVNSRVSIITVAQTGAILFTDSSDTIISDDDASITTDSVTTFGNGVVKMFSRGQLNSRLWL